MSDVRVFDLRGGPCELAASKWTPHITRDPAEIRGVVLHAWAVRSVGTTADERRRWGEPLALARRGLAAPYAVSAGVTRGGVPVVSVAHPVERYTYASDAGNAHYLAVSVMGLFPFTEEQRVASRHAAMTTALEIALHRALDEALALLPCDAPPLALITHRQCANGKGDHTACPGEAVVAAALRSPAVASGRLIADPDLVLVKEYGRPWPAQWRQHVADRTIDV